MKNIMMRETPIPTPARGAFDLSKESKISFQFGWLTPFLWYDVLPGDKFQINSEVLVKLAPLVAPVMHRVNVFTHFFFVPYRLCMYGDQEYGDWKAFITGNPDGYADVSLPYITMNDTNKLHFTPVSLTGYLGLPWNNAVSSFSANIDINLLPIFAYHVIYNEFYRDENLIDPVCTHVPGSGIGNFELVGGDHTSEWQDILLQYPYKRAYEKDLFRGALPTAYAGSDSDVELDLDFTAQTMQVRRVTGGSLIGSEALDTDGTGELQGATSAVDAYIIPESGSYATLEAMELRRMMAVTRWLEAENRGGTRYTETLLGIWGVKPENAELQIPQYIGGGRQTVQFSSILAGTNVYDSLDALVDPQGLETGRGVTFGKHHASYYAREHGVIMGIISVLPRTAYGYNLVDKFWRKLDREDFFVPQLQGIGDQAILQSEIGFEGDASTYDDVFGYAPPWYEYKTAYSNVAGAFMSELSHWHMATLNDCFSPGPDLNQAWIECEYTDDHIDRIFASSYDNQIFAHILSDVRAIRPMLVHDIPK
jgi:hypothetical protein